MKATIVLISYTHPESLCHYAYPNPWKVGLRKAIASFCPRMLHDSNLLPFAQGGPIL
uniref:Uncharacterized protein n=1 Tax=Arundo donax TaxID=35708 RepID=A0A0A9EZC0_ARUDO